MPVQVDDCRDPPVSYEHKSGSVVLKRGSTQGKVARFTNETETSDIIEQFRRLAR